MIHHHASPTVDSSPINSSTKTKASPKDGEISSFHDNNNGTNADVNDGDNELLSNNSNNKLQSVSTKPQELTKKVNTSISKYIVRHN